MTDTTAPIYNLLMLSGDNSVARGQDSAFARLLARFSRYWQRIDIVTPTAPDASECTLYGNVFVHPAPYHRLLQPLFIKRLGQALFAERPYHLVASHDFGFFYNGLGALWLLRGQTIPWVSEVHHVEGYPVAATWRERLWRLAARLYFPRIGQIATAFRVVNHQLPQILQALGVPQHKIHILYSLYLDFEIYRPLTDSTVGAIHESPPQKQYDVLFVGRLVGNKGILLLLDALAQVATTHPDMTLAIRGDGSLRRTIEARIAAAGLGHNVIFLPQVDDTAEMARLYQQARILVCASTVEGNPRVTIEAMACGVPVISTPVGIMPEVLRDGENGFLCDWDAAQLAQRIRLLLDDADLCTRIGEAGRLSVQRFDAETTIRDYALAYHAIIRDVLNLYSPG